MGITRKNRLTTRRRNTNRKNFLRMERLENRLALATAPVAVNDFYFDLIDQPMEISAPGILANDTADSGLSLSAGLFSGPENGTLSLSEDGSFTYQPDPGFMGLDSFLYFANDGAADSMLAAVTISVGEGGPPPDAVDDTYGLAEDGVLGLAISDGVLANDEVADGFTLSATLLAGPANGTLTLGEDGSLTYVPNADFSGTDSFTYTATDDAGSTDVATATITVNPVNDKPIAENDAHAMSEDGTLTVDAIAGLLSNDSDIDGDALTPEVTSQPLHGTVTVNPDGSFTYTPEANYNGLDGFSYLVSDGTTTSDVASATITIGAVNDLPAGVNDEYVTPEDTALEIAAPGVLVNDTDIDGDVLSSILVNPPLHGTVTLGGDGSLVYTPDADFNGVDGFSYIANDGSADSDAAAVTINVSVVNDAPASTADAYTTDEDAPLAIDVIAGVLANDSDVDGDPLSATVVVGPANGTLTLNADGSFSYTPNADFSGSDSFTYTAGDGELSSAETTVSLTVNPVNDGPVSAADAYTTDEDSPLAIDAVAGVLANDSDIDGGPLSATVVAGPANGTLTLNADGSFNYLPNANFSGSDSFTYTANDGTASGAETTVSITVNPTNDAPVGAADSYATNEDVALTIAAAGVLANDSDPDGDPLTATMINGPASGTLTLNADGSFTYAPNADYSGSDSFVYEASDGTMTTGPVTVSISVCPVNDAPAAADDAYMLDEGTTLTADVASGVLANDSDPEGDALTATVVTGPANGSLTLNGDGSFSYTPNEDFSGTDSFTYSAGDGGLVDEATVTLTVNPVAEAPVAAIDNYSTGEDVPLTIAADMGVLANDINLEGGEMTAEVVTGPAHGTLTLNSDGSFSFSPEANWHGTDSFTYKAVVDGQEMMSSANIVVEPLNDAPAAADDEFTIVTGQPGPTTSVVANDSDIDGDAMTASLVSGPSHGTLTLNSDGTFNYTPEEGFTGNDSFRYQAFDGMANSNVATVQLHIEAAVSEVPPPEETPPPAENPPPTENPPPEENPPPAANQRPLAVNDTFAMTGGTTLDTPAVSGLLVNDSDPEGLPITASLFSGPLHGSVSLLADGSFSYTPVSDYAGMDAFLYRASDGELWSPLAAVTVHVAAAPAPAPAPAPHPGSAALPGTGAGPRAGAAIPVPGL